MGATHEPQPITTHRSATPVNPQPRQQSGRFNLARNSQESTPAVRDAAGAGDAMDTAGQIPATPEKGQRMTEHDEQVALIRWAELARGKYPALRWLHAVPNGGARNI